MYKIWRKIQRMFLKMVDEYGPRQIFVAFVKDNATTISIRYFENYVPYFVPKPKEIDPIKLIFLRQVSVSIALKCEINNSV